MDALFTTEAVAAAVADHALVQAMLDAEAALARAAAQVGLVPAGAAERIAAACRAERFDLVQLGREARDAGNPVVPLVRALTAAVDEQSARHVHRGATSQDVLDTALVLVARRALTPLLADLGAVARACAELAAAHRDTVVAGRTLLQHAVPTTFGAKAAAWLVGLDDARVRLAAAGNALPAQLGGAAGTLSAVGPSGIALLEAYAGQLGLPAPTVPWHTVRVPLAGLAAALGIAAGAAGKVAADLALLASTEVAEVAEPPAPGRGGSSTLPHKRNPVGSVLAAACARRAPGLVATLLAAMVQEHERAAGAWHAEWEPLRELLRVTAGSAGHLAEVLPGLEVDTERMRANLGVTRGLLLAESVATRLGPALGRAAARDLLAAASRRAGEQDRPLREILLADPAVTVHLSAADLDAALDPAASTGSAGAFVDRALAAHRELRA